MIKYLHFAFNSLYLANGYRETKIGENTFYEYEREEELEQSIRRLVLRKPEPLRGWDLRFLRNGLGLSQSEFGLMVDRDAQSIARWEKSPEQIPKFVDVIIRMRFAEKFESTLNIKDVLNFSDGLSPPLPDKVTLTYINYEWVFNVRTTAKCISLQTYLLPNVRHVHISSNQLPKGYSRLLAAYSKTAIDISTHTPNAVDIKRVATRELYESLHQKHTAQHDAMKSLRTGTPSVRAGNFLERNESAIAIGFENIRIKRITNGKHEYVQ